MVSEVRVRHRSGRDRPLVCDRYARHPSRLASARSVCGPGSGLAFPTLYQVRSSGGYVRGGIILRWGHDSEWKPTDNLESTHVYVARHAGFYVEAPMTCVGLRRRRRPNAKRNALVAVELLGLLESRDRGFA